MTQIWFRNPKNYIREVTEVDHRLLVWDKGILIKNHIDPWIFSHLHYGENKQWRTMIIGSAGTVEITDQQKEDSPAAVYPTFSYGESLSLLEEIMHSNIGEDPIACASPDIPVAERPILGQEHRVIIADIPDARTGSSRVFYRELKELQEEYPDCILHLHGSYAFRQIFGLGYQSGDWEPRTYAANKMIALPTGKNIKIDRAPLFQQWFNLMGMKLSDMKVPRQRCIFNIRAAIWASEHWDENMNFKSRGKVEVDPRALFSKPVQATTQPYRGSPEPGDKISCDTCSLANTCKYHRDGAVCSIPGTESSVMATYFKSRDSSKIIDALGTVLAAQSDRVETGMKSEEILGDLDPQVSKELNSLFKNGVSLAKLVDPSLTKPGVNINVGAGAAVAGASPNAIMAGVIRALEEKGIRREDITPEMIQDMLSEIAGGPKQVEGTVVSNG